MEINDVELIEPEMDWLVRSRPITCPVELSHVMPSQEQQSVLGVQERSLSSESKRVSKKDFWSSRHWAEIGL